MKYRVNRGILNNQLITRDRVKIFRKAFYVGVQAGRCQVALK